MQDYKEDKGAPAQLQTVEEFIIACFPSKALREHLWENRPEWSEWQKGCLVRQYMNPYDGFRCLMQLAYETRDEQFEELLGMITERLERSDLYESEEAQKYYEKVYADDIESGKKSKEYLQDYVGLPVLFNIGDLVTSRDGHTKRVLIIKKLPEQSAECCDEVYTTETVPNLDIVKDGEAITIKPDRIVFSIPVACADEANGEAYKQAQDKKFEFIKELMKKWVG